MKSELLHVVTAISNPVRWDSRINLYKQFEEHMLDSGVNLTVVECQYGERPHDLIPTNKFVNHIPVRAKTQTWNKENLLNIGIARIPEAKYICWSDADIEFRKNSWAADTVHALQQYDIVQPWTDAYDLGPNDEHIQAHKSFCYQWWNRQPVIPNQKNFWKHDGGPYAYPHTGFCWAANRVTLEWLGGLLDICAMGSADHHMALSLIGEVDRSVPGGVTQGYLAHLKRWEARALRHVNKNIGFVWGTIEHFFHGRKTDRKYIDRWDMFVKHQFNPDNDLKRNSYGVYEFAGNKPDLQHEWDLYLRNRNEDTNTLN